MELSKKIVIKIPLDCLWTDKEILDVKRETYLDQNNIQALLKNGPLQFVVANLGDKLAWTPVEDCYKLYKTIIKDHLIDPTHPIYLKGLKDEWGYLASLWAGDTMLTIILLEMFH
jgi:hypothetical protein